MISPDEMEVIDTWRYRQKIPTRAAAIRELLRRGLGADDLGEPSQNADSESYSVLPDAAQEQGAGK